MSTCLCRILPVALKLLLMVCNLFQLSSQSDVHNNAVQIFDLLAKALLNEHVDYAIGKCYIYVEICLNPLNIYIWSRNISSFIHCIYLMRTLPSTSNYHCLMFHFSSFCCLFPVHAKRFDCCFHASHYCQWKVNQSIWITAKLNLTHFPFPELGLQVIPSGEVRTPPEVSFFEVVHQSSSMMNLLDKLFSDTLVPLVMWVPPSFPHYASTINCLRTENAQNVSLVSLFWGKDKKALSKYKSGLLWRKVQD